MTPALRYLTRKMENDWSASLCGLLAVDQRPLETTPHVCHALKNVFLAQAQACAVAQAHKGGAAPKPSAMCKLCVGCAELVEGAASHLRSELGKDVAAFSGVAEKSDSGCGLLDHWDFLAHAYWALAHRFFAADLWGREEWGQAVAHQRKCVTRARQPAALLGQLAGVATSRAAWADAEARTLAGYEHENGTIYYGQVPPDADLEPLPVHAVLMKPAPMPEVDVVPISLHRPGDNAAAFSSAAAPAPADAPPPAYAAAVEPPPPGYSDAVGQAQAGAGAGAAARLEAMGFSPIAVMSALSFNSGDEAAALETLLKAA